jgi:hypothetical protein
LACVDAELVKVIEAWPWLPEHVRLAMVVLVCAQIGRKSPSLLGQRLANNLLHPVHESASADSTQQDKNPLDIMSLDRPFNES